MASRAARFTQSDVKRAFKGATSAGIRVGRIEIDPNGKIVIEPAIASTAGTSASWDDVLR